MGWPIGSGKRAGHADVPLAFPTGGWAATAVVLGAVVVTCVSSANPSPAARNNAGAVSASVSAPAATIVQLLGPPDPAANRVRRSSSRVRPAAHSTTTKPKPSAAVPGGSVSALTASGLPITALQAYEQAAAAVDPTCHMPWPLLAAIGRVESNHGRFGDSQLYSNGVSRPPIIGIALNGHGTALIRDSDEGRLDGDTVYDRAVGPMQFIPSTWAGWGVDGNHDGRVDPFNSYDAAGAAARYLCRAGGDLSTGEGQVAAVLSYNHSSVYLAEVLALEQAYAAGAGVTVPVPSATTLPTTAPTLPPVNPGAPPTTAPPTTAPSGTSASAPDAHPTSAPASEPASSSSHLTPKPSTSSSSPSSAPSPSSSLPIPSASRSPTTTAASSTATAPR